MLGEVIQLTIVCLSLVLAAQDSPSTGNQQDSPLTGNQQDSPLIGSQCILGNGRCSYYVNLLPGCSDATTTNDLPRSLPLEMSNAEQTERFQDMERNLVVLRVEHARRITDLESQLERLLGNAGGGGGASMKYASSQPAGLGNTAGLKRKQQAQDSSLMSSKKSSSLVFKDEEDRGENLLLVQVHKEFSGLRRELANSRRQVRILENQLEEARSKLNRTSVSLIRTTSRLLETEGKLEDAIADKERLALQLSETKNDLAVTKTRLDERTKELKNTTAELLKTRKRNEALQVGLDLCIAEKDSMRSRLNDSLVRNGELSRRYENLTAEFKKKEALLIECFRGKTSQFCGFEDPKICGFVQDKLNDDVDWIRWRDRTPSPITGPTVDHTCGNSKGYYMYFDASQPGRGTKARMLSGRYYGFTDQCVQFFYHMHGRHIGTLNVYTVVPGNDVSPLWRAYGNQGDVWINARLSIPAAVAALGYQVVFEAMVDRGYQGDIAVDDFQVFDGYC